MARAADSFGYRAIAVIMPIRIRRRRNQQTNPVMKTEGDVAALPAKIGYRRRRPSTSFRRWTGSGRCRSRSSCSRIWEWGAMRPDFWASRSSSSAAS